MKRLAGGFAALAVAAATAGATLGPTSSAVAGQVDGPGDRGHLNDVTIFNSTTAWAVGNSYHNGHLIPRAERWDGTTWTRVPVPQVPGHDARLIGVAGSSPTDIWTIGAYVRHWRFISFADHWDGTGWTRMPFPNVQGPFGSLVQDLSVDGAKDAWTTGSVSGSRPWVVHWDGTAWRRIPFRDLVQRGTTVQVFGVSALSNSDAWVSGEVGTSTRGTETLIAHWDGTGWTRMATPSIAHRANALTAIDALSDTDIWAVGVSTDNKTGAGKPLALHFDGSDWTRVPLPPTGRYSDLADVNAAARDDAWAVGDNGNHALAMHWDGDAWSLEPLAPPAQTLASVVDFSQNLALTVGSYRNGTELHEKWDGGQWSAP